MGLDLTLMPRAYEETNPQANFSHDLISLSRDPELFDKILRKEKFHGVPAPDGFNSFRSRSDKFEDPHYGETTQTHYGQRMMSVKASHLKTVFSRHINESWRNKAVESYISRLPDNLPVYLFWH